MPCVNATGNHKLPMMMIGKSANPRCFKKKTIPLYYRSSKIAWQTLTLFKKWYTEQFVLEVSMYLKSKNLPIKALLLMDNASCHGTSLSMPEHDDFQILYLPPNQTPYLQPLDQHVIKSFKTRYRKHLLSTLAATKDDIFVSLKNINLNDVAYITVESWNEVPKSVIKNAFKMLYPSLIEIEMNLPINHFEEEDDVPIATLYNSILKENDLSVSEIMEWACGENESNHIHNADLSINEDNEVEENLDASTNPQVTFDINNVIDSFNLAIEWSENINLPPNDILLQEGQRKSDL